MVLGRWICQSFPLEDMFASFLQYHSYVPINLPSADTDHTIDTELTVLVGILYRDDYDICLLAIPTRLRRTKADTIVQPNSLSQQD